MPDQLIERLLIIINTICLHAKIGKQTFKMVELVQHEIKKCYLFLSCFFNLLKNSWL